MAPESDLATGRTRLTALGDDVYCREGWASRFQQVLVSPDSCNSIYSVSGVRFRVVAVFGNFIWEVGEGLWGCWLWFFNALTPFFL